MHQRVGTVKCNGYVAQYTLSIDFGIWNDMVTLNNITLKHFYVVLWYEAWHLNNSIISKSIHAIIQRGDLV